MEAQEHPFCSAPARLRAATRRHTLQFRRRELCQRPASHFQTPSTDRPRARPFCSHPPPRLRVPEAGLTPRPHLLTGPLRLPQAGADAATAVLGFRRRALILRATPRVTVDPVTRPTIGLSRRLGRDNSNIRQSRRLFLRLREEEEVRKI
jgi:hypothetical protein